MPYCIPGPCSKILAEETASSAASKVNRALEKGAYTYSRRPETFIHVNENRSHIRAGNHKSRVVCRPQGKVAMASRQGRPQSRAPLLISPCVLGERMHNLRVKPHGFHGDWNYTVQPRRTG